MSGHIFGAFLSIIVALVQETNGEWELAAIALLFCAFFLATDVVASEKKEEDD